MQLTTTDKKRINQFYGRKLKKFGLKDAQSVDWESNKDQKTRFEILSKIGDLNGKKVLDFGSGLGGLYGYLSKRFKNISYTGIDVVSVFVEQSAKKYPKAKFECIELNAIKDKFDYAFAAGSLTFDVAGGKKYYFNQIKAMYKLAKKGVGFNMLNKDFFGEHKGYITYDPLEVLDFCKTFAKHVQIIFNYVEGEFTVYLKK
ncbi:MAG: hypothetical protein JWO40_563 [Candidatus Doudnabacteria bacterium]|nr:hypothetical protein [Candidatus Doudnabacteria bacterium]